VRKGERLSFWREAVCRNLNGITCRSADGQSLDGKLRAVNANDHTVATLRGGEHRAIRTHRVRKTLDDEFFILFYQLEGSMGVEVNNREFYLNPKEYYLYDSRHTHQLIFEDAFNHIAIRIPRTKLRSRWHVLSRLGSFKYAADDDPLAALIGGNIQTLAGIATQLSEVQLELAVDNIFELFDVSVRECTSSNSDVRVGSIEALRARADLYIDNRIADEQLSPNDVARHLGITRRYLDRIFKTSGETVYSHILSKRLKNCACELRSHLGAHLSISEIAYAWGFQTASHFSKCFRREFGISPSDYRTLPITVDQANKGSRIDK
jgi:AraC family transcriptional regulator, positive regulator of tynA and feaB